MELDQVVKPNPEVVCTDVGGKEAVLLHLDTKKYYSLNATGLRIWQLLSDGQTPADVVEQLQAEFDVTPEKASESVIGLMNELISEKLIQTGK
jgi:hypothetical protein